MKAVIILLACILALVNAAPAPQILGVYPVVSGFPLTHHAYEEHHDHRFGGPFNPFGSPLGSPLYRPARPILNQFGAAYVAQPMLAQPAYPYGYAVVG